MLRYIENIGIIVDIDTSNRIVLAADVLWSYTATNNELIPEDKST